MTTAEYMPVRDFFESQGIPYMPIHVSVQDDTQKGVFLEDGSLKKKKDLKKKDNAGLVTFNDFDDTDKIKRRFQHYEANPSAYNFWAYSTDTVKVIDIDCMNIPEKAGGKINPIRELCEKCKQNQYFWKKSSGKKFGRHIFVVIPNYKNTGKRGKKEFKHQYGEAIETHKGNKIRKSAGVELLDGQWGWARMGDQIAVGKKLEWDIGDQFYDMLKTKIKKPNKKGTTSMKKNKKIDKSKVKKKVTKVKKSKTKTPESKYKLDDVKKNLKDLPDMYVNNYHKWGGIIKACASSEDEEVFNLVLEWSKTSPSFRDEADVRKEWDHYKTESNPELFKSLFDERISKVFVKSKKLKRPSLTNAEIGNYFLEKYRNMFVINSNFEDAKDGLAYFNGDVWERASLCESKIYTMLCSEEIRGHFRQAMIDAKLHQAKRAEKAKCCGNPDYEILPDDELLEKVTNEVDNYEGKGKCPLKQAFEYHTNLNTTVKYIVQHLIQMDTIRLNIHFNMGQKTKHYVQFKNGAFNLKTGLLEQRTRDMYITKKGVLNYNYYPLNPEHKGYNEDYAKIIKQNMKTLEKTDKMIIPNEKIRIGFYTWRGLNLTGETKNQQFMMNIGKTGNGKTTLTMRFAYCFPIYSQKLSGDCLKTDMEDKAFNKSFSAMLDKPIRLAYITEWGQMNCKLINEVIDTDELTVKPLYKEAYNMPVQFKLEGSLNPEHWEVDNIKATGRRANLTYYNSNFTTDSSKVDEKNHTYKSDPELLTKNYYADNLRKLAVFHQYAPYSQMYYKKGLLLPKELKTNFQNKILELDPFTSFVDECIEKDEGEKYGISKFRFMEMYDEWTKEQGIKSSKKEAFNSLKKKMNNIGYKYDSQAKKCVDYGTTKGWFSNCKLVDDMEDSDEEQDEVAISVASQAVNLPKSPKGPKNWPGLFFKNKNLKKKLR